MIDNVTTVAQINFRNIVKFKAKRIYGLTFYKSRERMEDPFREPRGDQPPVDQANRLYRSQAGRNKIQIQK